MNIETELINSVIDNDNWADALNAGVEDVIEEHKDVWTFIHDYVGKYDTLPTKRIVQDHFTHFSLINTKDTPFQYYVDEAKKNCLSKNLRQSLMQTIQILQDAGPNAAMNFISTSTFKLMKDTGAIKDTNLADEYQDRVNNYIDRYKSDTHIAGIPTGIQPIDEIFGGLQGGDFVTLIGWTGSKKTWLALLLAINAWKGGYRPLYISLEMNKYQMGYRVDTLLNSGEVFTNDDLTHARELDPNAYEKWARDTFEGKHPFHVVTAEGLETASQATVEAKVNYYKPDVVFLDYHQLFEDAGRGGTETEKAKNLSTAFKKIAVKYDIPVVDICSVTMKEGQGDRAPKLSEVAWTRQLAFDSDMCLSVFSPNGTNITEVVTEKTRRCQDFAFILDWDINKGTWDCRYGNNQGVNF